MTTNATKHTQRIVRSTLGQMRFERDRLRADNERLREALAQTSARLRGAAYDVLREDRGYCYMTWCEIARHWTEQADVADAALAERT